MYAALILAGICVVAFVLQAIVSGFTGMFVLESAQVLSRPWILLTSMFLHADIVHLLYNMFALVLFGMILEQIVGKKRFIIIYFSSGILAGVGAAFLYNSALGASGAIFGLLGTLAILRPRMQVWVSYVPMPMIVAAAVWAFLDFFRLFVPTGIASLAHLVGLFFGLGTGFYLRKKFGEHREAAAFVDEDDIKDWEDGWMKK